MRVGTHTGFTQVHRGYRVPRPGTGEPSTGFGRALQRLKHLVLGSPIPTARESLERLTAVRALALFSSGVLSSVAYAAEEIMKARQALAFARAIAPDLDHVDAVHVTDDVTSAGGRLRQRPMLIPHTSVDSTGAANGRSGSPGSS